MSTRFLGIAFLVGSLIVMLNGFRASALEIRPFENTLGAASYFLWGIGGICGILGLMRLNVLGTNTLARAAGLIPLVGFTAFVVGEGLRLAGFINMENPLYTTLGSIAWIAILGGMLIVGILTIAVKTWRGWQRFVPLLVPVMAPVGLMISSAIDNPYLGGLLGWAPWILLGLLIATAERSPALQPA
jgi:hypothetical protein